MVTAESVVAYDAAEELREKPSLSEVAPPESSPHEAGGEKMSSVGDDTPDEMLEEIESARATERSIDGRASNRPSNDGGEGRCASDRSEEEPPVGLPGCARRPLAHGRAGCAMRSKPNEMRGGRIPPRRTKSRGEAVVVAGFSPLETADGRCSLAGRQGFGGADASAERGEASAEDAVAGCSMVCVVEEGGEERVGTSASAAPDAFSC